jgi:signal transduction histidine kinase
VVATRRGLPAAVREATLAVAVAAFQVRGTVLVTPAQDGVRPLAEPGWAGYLLLVAGGLVLLGRRRHPAAVLGAEAAISAGYYLAGYPDGPGWVGLFVALYTVTAQGDGRRTLAAAAATVAGLSAVWLLTADLVPLNGAGWVFFRIGAAVMAAALGESVRGRLAAAEAEHRAAVRAHEERARRQVDAERLRLAREVHDTVAHALSVINVQAGTTAHVLDRRPEQAKTALRTVERTSALALRELRSTLGMLRDDAPSPATGLAQLDRLVDATRAAGLRVDVDDRSRPDLPAAVDHAAYRIVQEALTNAVRHAGATRVRVSISAGPGALDVAVVDDGSGGGASGGHGITGMRERAELLGGELTAGSAATGGFAVRARLPLDPDPARVR